MSVADRLGALDLTDAEASYVRLYSPGTYGISLPPDMARRLEDGGIVQSMLPAGWSGATYGLTEHGWSVLSTPQAMRQSA